MGSVGEGRLGRDGLRVGEDDGVGCLWVGEVVVIDGKVCGFTLPAMTRSGGESVSWICVDGQKQVRDGGDGGKEPYDEPFVDLDGLVRGRRDRVLVHVVERGDREVLCEGRGDDVGCEALHARIQNTCIILVKNGKRKTDEDGVEDVFPPRTVGCEHDPFSCELLYDGGFERGGLDGHVSRSDRSPCSY